MKTLRLDDGDLVIGTDSDYAKVTGPAKMIQDLRCALLEPLGNDRFHPGYGSRLEDFIALSNDEEAAFEVESEVRRVVSNYAAVQRDMVEAETFGGEETTFTTDEIIDSLTGISAKITDETVRVTVGLATAAGNQVLLSEVV